MMLLVGSVVGLKTLINAQVSMDEPRNLVTVSSILVFGVGGLALNFDGLTLQGMGLCGVLAVLFNIVLPVTRKP